MILEAFSNLNDSYSMILFYNSMKLVSAFEWMNSDICLSLFSNLSLLNKKGTFIFSKQNSSTTNGLNVHQVEGRWEGEGEWSLWDNLHRDRRNTSRGEMELMPHREAASVSKTSWQYWCVSRLWEIIIQREVPMRLNWGMCAGKETPSGKSCLW